MTPAGWPRSPLGKIVRWLLAALVGFLLVLAAVIVGEVPAAAQNAVGASSPASANTVGPLAGIGAGQRLGKVVPQPQIVVATAVAAEADSGLLRLSTEESWGNPGSLARHFRDHGADFGATSAEEYASEASSFFQRGLQEGLPTKIDSDGVIRIYDPNTNTFGAFNANGTTRTFYKPSSPTYWDRQPGNAP